MEKNFHLVEQRLENIKTIIPLLTSLRTISLSSWKLSLNKLSYLDKFSRDMGEALDFFQNDTPVKTSQSGTEEFVLVLGSSRGLCGSFNRDLFLQVEKYLSDHPKTEARFILFGEKIQKLFIKNNLEFEKCFNYPRVSVLDYQYIYRIICQLSNADAFPSILLIFNDYQGSSRYQAAIRQITPLPASMRIKEPAHDNLIVDGDYQALVRYSLKQKNLVSIYRAFLSSFAAEHSRRFEIMETALSNTDKLIQELTISAQVERQKRVTSEMRELSISAGLLEKSNR